MPPLLIVTLGIVGAAALVGLIMKERNRVNAELQEARVRARTDREQRSTLRRDQDGVYRP